MIVIAVLNQKGGAGKTTLATQLASGLARKGADVVLVDSDPQGTIRDWAALNDAQPVKVVGIDRPTIGRDIGALGRRDFVVIDGAPQAADLAVSAIKAADVVLIPVQPSPYDIWATSDLVDLVKARQEVTDGKLKAAFVVSRAINGTRLSRDIAGILADYDLPVLNGRITQRVIYPTTAGDGLTVFDVEPEGEAAAECWEIIAETMALAGVVE